VKYSCVNTPVYTINCRRIIGYSRLQLIVVLFLDKTEVFKYLLLNYFEVTYIVIVSIYIYKNTSAASSM